MTAPPDRDGTAAAVLAEWAVNLTPRDVPEDVMATACDQVLDTLGCGLAALGLGESTAGVQLAVDYSRGGPSSTIGVPEGSSVTEAALANGMLCHALDFDNTHPGAICHISTVVVPAALAIGESVGAAGVELLAAVVAGTEAVSRIGLAVPGGFHQRGFHATSVCGVFGATLAACRLQGFDIPTTTRAVGLAGSMASGLFEFLSDGSSAKAVHAGWAAQAGIQAAALSAAGAAGPASVLEGRFGLFATHVDSDPDIDTQLRDLGERWEARQIAVKAYPVCHFIPAAVDAAVEAASGIDAVAIDEIVIRVPEVAVPIVLEPGIQKCRPTTPYDAKFSLPWCLAARILHGRLDVRSFVGDAFRDASLTSFAARVRHAAWTRDGPVPPFGAAAEISARGTVHQATVLAPRGAPENPMSHADVVAKFITNATLALEEHDAHALPETVGKLTDAGNIDALLRPLRGARAHTVASEGSVARQTTS